MASKNPIMRLGHIRAEIHSITRRLAGVDRATFVEDYLLLRASERALLIISEAAKSLPKDLTSVYSEIDWRAVCGLGDVLRHDYNRVDPGVIWEIIIGKLPELAPVVERMINDLEKP